MRINAFKGIKSDLIKFGLSILSVIFFNFLLAVEPVYSQDADGADGAAINAARAEYNAHLAERLANRNRQTAGNNSDEIIVQPSRTFADSIEDGDVEFSGEILIDEEAAKSLIVDPESRSISLVSPSAGLMNSAHKITSPTKNELLANRDFIQFVNVYGAAEDKRGLVEEAWLNYVKLTFEPLLTKGEITKDEYVRIQTQYSNTVEWLKNHSEYSDGDHESITATELYIASKAGPWLTFN